MKLFSKTTTKNEAGFSLIEVIIVAAIMSGLVTVYLQMTQVQNKNAQELQLTIARIDLEKAVLNTLSNGAICSFLLNDASQASPGNRSVDTFDSAAISAGSPLTINIKNLLAGASASSPFIAEVGKSASALTTKLIVAGMKFNIIPNQPPDIFLGEFQIDFEQPSTMRKIKSVTIKNIQIATDSTSPANAKKIIGCSGWGEPRAQRYSFTTTSTWTVPVGARKAFVTMAGGGGSGMGWRIVSTLGTGNSGGYIFSQPINVTPGEVMQVIVGKGGKGYAAVSTGVAATPGPPYFIHTNPPGDDGLGGYPGESSKLISPVQGTLLECAGGSGRNSGGIDNYSGGRVAGDLPGAQFGGGSPIFPAPNRAALGPYAKIGGPGSCGPGPVDYGLGNGGSTLWGITSGTFAGGSSPFGYGSGGDIGVSGCYINATTVGTCIYPANGRDGVVFIDTW